jgi:hypothetical protein
VVNKKANVKIEMRTKGGKPELWLAESAKASSSTSPSDSQTESIRQKWAKSFDNTNLYPIAYELKPVWELVKQVDAEKGRQYENYLRKKWDANVSEINQAKFLKSKRISSLTNVKEILKFCRDYAADCEEQEVKAGNRMETFSFIVCFNKRFVHWKSAAKDGREEFTKLIAAINDPKTTVKQFKGMVEGRSAHFRIHALENKGSYWLQLYRNHAEKLMNVVKMIEEGKIKCNTDCLTESSTESITE